MKKENNIKEKAIKHNPLTNKTIKYIFEFQTVSKTIEIAWTNTAEWFLVS